MKKLIIVFLVVLFVVAAGISAVQTTKAEMVWKLGDRVVPGPLPPNFKAPAPELDSILDLSYGDHKLQRIDFYRPTVCEGQTLPLAVYIHGGGFVKGDKERGFKRSDSTMLFQMGFAVASVNYRLAPDFEMHYLIEDCKLAIRYLKANANDLGIDPERIAIWGTSAGGHLVGILGTADDDDGLEGEGLLEYSSRVNAVVNQFGTADFTTMFKQINTERAKKNIQDFFGKETFEECFDEAKRTSTVTYASSDDPPMLIQHGDADPVVPYAQSRQLAKTLFEADASCALVKVSNGGHGFGAVDKAKEVIPGRKTTTFQCVAHLARYIEPEVLGDLNLDGSVNLDDMFELASLIGYQGTDKNGNPAPNHWNPLADLVPDGKINIKDWELFWEIY